MQTHEIDTDEIYAKYDSIDDKHRERVRAGKASRVRVNRKERES